MARLSARGSALRTAGRQVPPARTDRRRAELQVGQAAGRPRWRSCGRNACRRRSASNASFGRALCPGGNLQPDGKLRVLGSRWSGLLKRLSIGTRVLVHGATTDLDPAVFGPGPSVNEGRIVLSGTLTAGVEFEDGVEVFGIPWAVIKPLEATETSGEITQPT